MRIARGTGPTGLAGIRPWRRLKGTQTDLVRPFLKVSKSEIMDFLKHSNTPFCIDPTNSDVDHQTRAWIRQSLIPAISNRLNPKSVQALGRLADLVREEQDELSLLIHDHYKNSVRRDLFTQSCQLQLNPFRMARTNWLRRQILRKIWLEMGWPMREMSLQHWVRLSRWVNSKSISEGCVLHLPGFILATKTVSEIRFQYHLDNSQVTLQESFNESLPISFDSPGEVLAGDLEIQSKWLSTIPTIPEIIAFNPSEYAVIDPAKLVSPMLLRHPQNGDQFAPLGLNGHHQKLVDFLRTQGVSNHSKKLTWVLCDQIGIVWVVSHRVADRVKITPDSRSALLISARKIGSEI
jgi:tRNA(Ile)-lysidine synthase